MTDDFGSILELLLNRGFMSLSVRRGDTAAAVAEVGRTPNDHVGLPRH
jgi:hypothetical protein